MGRLWPGWPKADPVLNPFARHWLFQSGRGYPKRKRYRSIPTPIPSAIPTAPLGNCFLSCILACLWPVFIADGFGQNPNGKG